MPRHHDQGDRGRYTDHEAECHAVHRLREPGRANYQIAVSICSACGQGAMRASGEAIPVSAEVIERAECDAQTIQLNEHPHVGQPPRTTQGVAGYAA